MLKRDIYFIIGFMSVTLPTIHMSSLCSIYLYILLLSKVFYMFPFPPSNPPWPLPVRTTCPHHPNVRVHWLCLYAFMQAIYLLIFYFEPFVYLLCFFLIFLIQIIFIPLVHSSFFANWTLLLQWHNINMWYLFGYRERDHFNSVFNFTAI